MQEIHSTQPIVPQMSQLTWLSSIIVLSVVIIAIFSLTIHDYYRQWTIADMENQITTMDRDLQVGNDDRDIIVANILSSSPLRPSIDLKALVKWFRLAAATAGVRLNWFSVADDTISSTLIATQWTDNTDPVKTIISMMRIPNPLTGLMLEPIYSLAGSSTERTTTVSFKILPSKTTTDANK